MSALQDQSASLKLPAGLIDMLRDALWTWIMAHQDDDVFTAKIWVFRKTFKVRDLDAAFELLLGPKP